MSMIYCHTHDLHYDSDFVEECPQCEEEEVEEIPMFKGTRDALDKLKI